MPWTAEKRAVVLKWGGPVAGLLLGTVIMPMFLDAILAAAACACAAKGGYDYARA